MPDQTKEPSKQEIDANYLRGFSEGNTINFAEVRRFHEIADRIAPGSAGADVSGRMTLLESEQKQLQAEKDRIAGENQRLREQVASKDKELMAERGRAHENATQLEALRRNQPAPGSGAAMTGQQARGGDTGGQSDSSPSLGTHSDTPREPAGGAISQKDLTPPPTGRGIPNDPAHTKKS